MLMNFVKGYLFHCQLNLKEKSVPFYDYNVCKYWMSLATGVTIATLKSPTE